MEGLDDGVEGLQLHATRIPLAIHVQAHICPCVFKPETSNPKPKALNPKPRNPQFLIIRTHTARPLTFVQKDDILNPKP